MESKVKMKTMRVFINCQPDCNHGAKLQLINKLRQASCKSVTVNADGYIKKKLLPKLVFAVS